MFEKNTEAPTIEQRLEALEAEVQSLRAGVMYLHHGTGVPPGTPQSPSEVTGE